MDQRQSQTDQREDSKGVGKTRSRFGQILEFGQTLKTKKSIRTKNRNETTPRNGIQNIGGEYRDDIVQIELTRTKIVARQNAMVLNKQAVAEIT